MDSKTIIAIVLMMLIYVYFLSPEPKPPVAINSTTTSQQQSQKLESQKLTTGVERALAGDSISKSQFFDLKNEKLELRVNQLGSVFDAKLQKYYVDVKKTRPVDFSFPQGFNQLNLNNSAGALDWKVTSASSSAINLEALAGKARFNRTIELKDYSLVIKDALQNASTQTIKLKPSLRLVHPLEEEKAPTGFFKQMFQPQADVQQAVFFVDGSLDHMLLSAVTGPTSKEGMINWAGFSHKYFFMGAVPQNISMTKILRTRETTLGVVEDIELSEKQIEPGSKLEMQTSFYLGPKEISELKPLGDDLTQVVEYGSWLGPIARFLLSVLHFFYSLIGNYGIAIILLTIMVKAVLFPLAYKAAVSMRRLQLVAPKMKELRNKYKDDKYRMNAEVMALYKTEKVNPVGGCLPMLLQMPVFFALYRVFFVSIELRQAPFYGWIKDLAAHDPYLVTPILMIGLMWAQQSITPMPPVDDENEAAQMQRKMMKWMPLFFGALMLFLPAGLNLYMLTNALFSVFQQLWLNKHLNLKFPLPNAIQSRAHA